MVIYNRLPSETEKQHCVKSVRVASVSVQSWGGGSGGGRSIAHQSARFGTGRGSLASVRKAAKAPSRAETFMIRRGVNLKEVGFKVFIVSLHCCSVVLITVNLWCNRVKLCLFQNRDWFIFVLLSSKHLVQPSWQIVYLLAFVLVTLRLISFIVALVNSLISVQIHST